MKHKTYIKFCCLALIVILTAYIVSNAVSILIYSKTDEKCSADTAIILGAGTNNNDVTPVFLERINHGIWLYQNGYIDKIILTGGYSDNKNNDYSDSFIAKLYLLSQDIPAEDIFVEEDSSITQENIANAKNIMNDNSYNSAILVSDPLHMKRAMLMAKDYGITAYSSPTPTTMYKSFKTRFLFLARELFFVYMI